jgi:transcriptional regulator with XRE-family HTH domain
VERTDSAPHQHTPNTPGNMIQSSHRRNLPRSKRDSSDNSVIKRIHPEKSEKTFGEMVKHRRQTLNLTQRQLGQTLGVKGSHIAYLEKGRRRPSLALIKRLAHVLDLDGRQLFLLAHPEAKSLLSGSGHPSYQEDPGRAWQRFVNSRPLHVRYQITPREIQALKQLSLLGYVLTELEFLAVLTLIRN